MTEHLPGPPHREEPSTPEAPVKYGVRELAEAIFEVLGTDRSTEDRPGFRDATWNDDLTNLRCELRSGVQPGMSLESGHRYYALEVVQQSNTQPPTIFYYSTTQHGARLCDPEGNIISTEETEYYLELSMVAYLETARVKPKPLQTRQEQTPPDHILLLTLMYEMATRSTKIQQLIAALRDSPAHEASEAATAQLVDQIQQEEPLLPGAYIVQRLIQR